MKMMPVELLAVAALVMAPDTLPLYEINTSRFHIPVDLSAQKASRVQAVEFWMSHDRGRSWSRLAVLDPKGQTAFDPPQLPNGEYWFGLHVRMKDGSVEPYHSKKPYSVMRVRVVERETLLGVEFQMGSTKLGS